MNWNIFLIWLSSIYLLYYLLNIAFDLIIRAPKQKVPSGEQVLTFSEDELPVTVDAAGRSAAVPRKSLPPAVKRDKALPASGIGYTGDVSLAEMFELAKADVLQVTKAIAY